MPITINIIKTINIITTFKNLVKIDIVNMYALIHLSKRFPVQSAYVPQLIYQTLCVLCYGKSHSVPCYILFYNLA